MNTSSHFRISGKASGTPELQPDGSLIVRGQRVFRVGSFRNSLGIKTEWSHEDLVKAAANFTLLGDHELPNIPVRKDHSRTIEAVAGYFSKVYVDGDYLVADYSILTPEDVAKFQQGIFRSVSLEIGSYRSNDEVVHSPVVMGLALVDLPAVEGLFTLHQEETEMITQEQLDLAVAMTYAAGLEALEAKPVDKAVVDHAVASGYAQADLDVRAEFAAADEDRPLFQFALADGSLTNEYASVQALITSQAATIAAGNDALLEQRTVNRHDFVTALGTDGKITAPMVPGMKTHVEDLTPDAYTAFVALYSAAPVIPVFSPANVLGNPGGGQVDGGPAGQVAHLEMQVQMHRNAGMKQDAIEELPSWNALQDLKKTLEV